MNCSLLRVFKSARVAFKSCEAARRGSIIQTTSCLGSKTPASAGAKHFHLQTNVQSKVFSVSSGVEDMLFYAITEGKEQVPFSYFISALKKTGLHPSDPRLKHCMDKFRQASRESIGEVMIDRELFHRYNGGGDGLRSVNHKL